MTGFFILYVVIRCTLRPQDGPPVPKEMFGALRMSEKMWITATAIVPAVALIAMVLGSILAGAASPTEAAAVGVLGGILLTACYGRLTPGLLIEALNKTVLLNAAILIILAAGTLFSAIFILNGGRALVTGTIAALSLPPWAVIVLFLFILFLLGFIIDWVSMVLVCIPVFHPIVVSLGYDPLWFAVLVAIVIQTSYLTPPMAPAVFYFKTIAPPEITLNQMLRGVMPFVGLEIAVMAAVMLFPGLAVWLPGVLFGR
jgi:TRAP-type mannitol/chloroaromatic compound transport system permease large subunit